MRAHSRIAILGLVGVMLLTACGGGDPDITVYRDAENRSLFELPKNWNLYRAEELTQIAPVPFVPDIAGYRPISIVAFDGAAGRNLDNLSLDAATSPFPVGAHIIRQISAEEKDLLSRRLMAVSAYDVTNPGQGVEIDTWDFTFGRDFEGIGATVGLTTQDGQSQGLVYVLAVTNPEATELYSMAAGCSLECFAREGEQIVAAVESWIVNTRP
ncbi:MAG: hypothetical protein J4G11_01315 [Acidimicrobiia bacterium]|nr:hypothetical protein [Acidimicrobiia bacterium]